MAKNRDLSTALKDLELIRSGVRPLPVHLNMALANYLKKAKSGDPVLEDMTAMVEGIQLYLRHPYQREMSALDEVWRAGEVSLLYAPARTERSAPLLLVPSLINGSHILDLKDDNSFLKWLNDQGCSVYLLDWGAPVSDSGMATLDDLITQRLLGALCFLQEQEEAFHGLGYCMGGTLLALAAAEAGDIAGALRSLVFLAAPWDFHAGDRVLANSIQIGTPAALQMIEASGDLPADWIQSVFAQINADKTVQKFADFAALPQNSARAAMFVAVEDWLNDGIDLPGGLARQCLLDWYGTNCPASDKAKSALQKLIVPSLVVTSAKDRLVPEESALALVKSMAGAEVLRPAIGHIGMMAGRRATSDVWIPVRDWIFRN